MYELLGKEVELRVHKSVWSILLGCPCELVYIPFFQESRKIAISRPVDIEEMERGVRQCIATVNVRMKYDNLSLKQLFSQTHTL